MNSSHSFSFCSFLTEASASTARSAAAIRAVPRVGSGAVADPSERRRGTRRPPGLAAASTRVRSACPTHVARQLNRVARTGERWRRVPGPTASLAAPHARAGRRSRAARPPGDARSHARVLPQRRRVRCRSPRSAGLQRLERRRPCRDVVAAIGVAVTPSATTARSSSGSGARPCSSTLARDRAASGRPRRARAHLHGHKKAPRSRGLFREDHDVDQGGVGTPGITGITSTGTVGIASSSNR